MNELTFSKVKLHQITRRRPFSMKMFRSVLTFLLAAPVDLDFIYGLYALFVLQVRRADCMNVHFQ
jgi:hypothetical protein